MILLKDPDVNKQNESFKKNENIIDLASQELFNTIDETIEDVNTSMEGSSDSYSLKNSIKSIGILKLLVTNLLTWLKLQCSTINFEFKRYDIQELLSQSFEFIMHEAQRKGINLELKNKLPQGWGAYCVTDGDRMKQVVVTILKIALRMITKG